MNQNGKGKGKLVPTGKVEPALNVNYDIDHVFSELPNAFGRPVNRKQALVRSITCENGQPIPLGDCDLLVDKEILRLRHTTDNPEWLVLSSDG